MYYEDDTTCARTTFPREGVLMMAALALVTFMVRSLALRVYYFLLQLPSHYGVRFDPDLFLQSITMLVDEDIQDVMYTHMEEEQHILMNGDTFGGRQHISINVLLLPFRIVSPIAHRQRR
ncbi:hypothetical protein C8F04DRAFT_1268036 [Mycena alexandri]|uniref:Uncharacterized protein n=1 Tax=Mycena alexandri TaxID=1745969 RepID=A0AAD6SGQ4_9AGAR|nr:hypothetical protein C8F04DRAFT_1268036 [Mycena alexandri]